MATKQENPQKDSWWTYNDNDNDNEDSKTSTDFQMALPI